MFGNVTWITMYYSILLEIKPFDKIDKICSVGGKKKKKAVWGTSYIMEQFGKPLSGLAWVALSVAR